MLVANDDIKHGSAGAEFNSIAASIHLNTGPFLKGALEASNNAIMSSLYRENFRSCRVVYRIMQMQVPLELTRF